VKEWFAGVTVVVLLAGCGSSGGTAVDLHTKTTPTTVEIATTTTAAPTTTTPAPRTTTAAPTTTTTAQTLSNNNTYTNSDGTEVHSPAYTSDNQAPAGATAQCADGTYSFSQHRSGTCSHHGGVARWL